MSDPFAHYDAIMALGEGSELRVKESFEILVPTHTGGTAFAEIPEGTMIRVTINTKDTGGSSKTVVGISSIGGILMRVSLPPEQWHFLEITRIVEPKEK